MAATTPRFDWYETDTQIVLNILVKNMTADQVEVKFAPRSLNFTFKNPATDATQELALQLNGTISPSESTYRVSAVKAEIKMRKVSNFRWNKLEASQENGDAPTLAAPMASLQSVTSAPLPVLSFQSKMRTWEAQIKEIEAEEEKTGGPDDLFKKIYAGADEKTRRAMNKSFQESNGTVLSTNWNEVGAGHVDMKPPESSEWKNYD